MSQTTILTAARTFTTSLFARFMSSMLSMQRETAEETWSNTQATIKTHSLKMEGPAAIEPGFSARRNKTMRDAIFACSLLIVLTALTPKLRAQGLECTTDAFSQDLLPLCANVEGGVDVTSGQPASFTSWTQSDGPHFVYIDVNGDIDQTWFTLASGKWSTQNLTKTTGAPIAKAANGMTSWTQADGPHFVFEDMNGHVCQMFFETSSGEWITQDLTNFSSAPLPAEFATFTSWTQSDGPHVVYNDSNGNIDQIWFTVASGKWSTQNLSATTGAPAAAMSFGLTSWTQSDGPHFVFEDTNKHVHQMFFETASGEWLTQDLTAVTGAPIAFKLTSFTSWTQSDGPHFVYVDENGNIDQMWFTVASGKWSTQNLSATTGAPISRVANGLTSWTQSDGPHFVFEDLSGHVHQMFFETATGVWLTQDLTVFTGAPIADGIAFTSWTQSDGPHFVYADENGDVDQVWFTVASGKWNTQNLTATTDAPLADN